MIGKAYGHKTRALYTAVATTVAAGSILAVLLDNAPLGAAVGIVTGILVGTLMWSRKSKTDEKT